MCVKKIQYTESVVKTRRDFWKLFQQPVLKTYPTINLLSALKQMFNMFNFMSYLHTWNIKFFFFYPHIVTRYT